MSFGVATQTAVYSALVGHAPLMARVQGVFSQAPQNQAFPYVTIGEDTEGEWDTVNTLGADTQITVHTWSRTRNYQETKLIQTDIYNALHRADLTYAAHTFYGVDWVSSQSFIDSDGKTRHGIQTFRVMLERV